MRVEKGYLVVHSKSGKNSHASSSRRDWWLVKWDSGGCGGQLCFKSSVHFPKEYVGKKVRFKVEVLE